MEVNFRNNQISRFNNVSTAVPTIVPYGQSFLKVVHLTYVCATTPFTDTLSRRTVAATPAKLFT